MGTLSSSHISEQRFAEAADCFAALAGALAAALEAALSERADATLAVSGGRTPRHVLPLLAKAEVDWSRVIVTLTDERWVPPTDAESNENLVRECLLQGAARHARFVPLKTQANSPQSALPEIESRFRDLPGPLDVVYLGMGGDGHVASLFPGGPADDGAALVAATRAPSPPHERLSLALPMLLDARSVFLQLTGPDKVAVYAAARGTAPAGACPLRQVLHGRRLPTQVMIAEA